MLSQGGVWAQMEVAQSKPSHSDDREKQSRPALHCPVALGEE